MTRKRILFVDDEPHVLEGLQNLLRRQRHEWDMAFASGGAAALAHLDAAPFDVIVTDMRMPAMDGAELLERVKREHPSVTRIVLSGHAEREAVARALSVAHQFLSKPCDADVLRSVIERTCGLHDLLRDEALRRLVGRLDKLPSVPRTYLALSEALKREDIGSRQVGAIIERDPAMSVKVLQLVNSAYFGLAQQVVSIQQAVMYLGLDLVKSLTLSAHVFAAIPPGMADALSVEALQEHVLLTARLAKKFVGDAARGDEAFTAAMVHHVGQVVLACGMPAPFMAALRESRATGQRLEDFDVAVFGVSHATVGAYLLGVWGLPFPIVEAVAHHATPGLVKGGGARDVLAAVHVANACATTAALGTPGTSSKPASSPDELQVDRAFLESVGLLHRLPEWYAIACEEVTSVESADPRNVDRLLVRSRRG